MRNNIWFLILALFLPTWVWGQPSDPKDVSQFSPRKQPRYEFGVGGGAFHVPDYPGAKETRTRVIALPYFIYRGDILRADRDDGLRGRFINEDNIEGDISFNAAFNSNSEDNNTRANMPDIDWMGEVGPRLQIHFSKNPAHAVKLALPLRFVFAMDVESWEFFADDLGLTFNPELSITHRGILGPLTILRASVGGTWAGERLMDYFYEVKPQYATPQRPVYNAKEGYLSTDVGLSIVHFIPKLKAALFVGMSWNMYQDATNRSSPLLRDETTETYAVGLLWSLYQSRELADAN